MGRLDNLCEMANPRPAGPVPPLPAGAQPGGWSRELARCLCAHCLQAALDCMTVRVHEEGRDAIVAFHGAGLASMLLDDPDFAAEYKRLEVRRHLEERMPHPRCRLWFTGHGMGAALATLAAVDFQPAALYTFGSPRVFLSRSGRRWRIPAWRVVNRMDLVAGLPPPWRFRHVGRHVLLLPRTRILIEPHWWNRLPALFTQSVWLTQLLRTGLKHGYPRALHDLFARVLKDHAINSYLERLG